MGGACSTHERDDKYIQGICWKTLREGPLGRPRRGGEDDTGMDLGEICWEGVFWMNLAQDRDQWRAVVNTLMNLRVP
jgi:hypothetical protein